MGLGDVVGAFVYTLGVGEGGEIGGGCGGADGDGIPVIGVGDGACFGKSGHPENRS